jgi:hypothetical protein
MAPDAEPAEPDGGKSSTERLLEALLVDDAAIEWDPITGTPRVARRQKPDLDRQRGSA